MKNAWAKNGKESKEEEFLRKEGDVEEKNYGRKKKVRKEERVKVVSLLEPPNPTLLKVPAPHTSAFPGWTWWTQGDSGRK